MLAFALCTAALANDVYFNNQRADLLTSRAFINVNVRFDENGSVWIEAPQYELTIPQPDLSTKGGGSVAAGDVADGRYWLVLEDNQSVGHTVEVYVNGTRVHTVRSGEDTLLDLGRSLNSGANQVRFVALPGGGLGGGLLNVYVATGHNDGGVVVVDEVLFGFARRSNSSVEGGEETTVLTVP